MLQKYSFFLYFCTKEVFLLARKGRTRDFILTRNLKYLKPSGPVAHPPNNWLYRSGLDRFVGFEALSGVIISLYHNESTYE